MDEFNFNQEEYLKRINYKGNVSVNYDSLKALHHAQHFSIPFENFDICLGREIRVSPDALVNKLVKRKRGGYCFELNGLLLLALTSFGFEARALLGRVHLTGEPTGRGHQISLVTIEDNSWIVDLGFGSDSPRFPIPLDTNQPISSEGQTFRLIEHNLYGFMLQSQTNDEWKDLYSFDLGHVCAGDIDYGNHFTSTSKNSFFTTSRTAALPVKGGIITLFNTQLKKTINNEVEVIELKQDESYIKIVNETFDIEIDANYDDLKPLVLRDNT